MRAASCSTLARARHHRADQHARDHPALGTHRRRRLGVQPAHTHAGADARRRVLPTGSARRRGTGRERPGGDGASVTLDDPDDRPSWLARQTASFRALVPAFLGRFFENEITGGGPDLRVGVYFLVAFLAMPGFVAPVFIASAGVPWHPPDTWG